MGLAQAGLTAHSSKSEEARPCVQESQTSGGHACSSEAMLNRCFPSKGQAEATRAHADLPDGSPGLSLPLGAGPPGAIGV